MSKQADISHLYHMSGAWDKGPRDKQRAQKHDKDRSGQNYNKIVNSAPTAENLLTCCDGSQSHRKCQAAFKIC